MCYVFSFWTSAPVAHEASLAAHGKIFSPSPPKKERLFESFFFLSIAKAMVYHHAARVYLITEGVYHQP